uniref:Uncharacterized protein n=1 Tax=Rhizophora mucronata TaxID=61149 RepID=A0A2P2MX65_RHIMU
MSLIFSSNNPLFRITNKKIVYET